MVPPVFKIKDYLLGFTAGIRQSSTMKSVIRFSRKVIIPGFDGMPLYDVAEFFLKGLQKGALSMRAAAFSYNLFLAMFPAIIFFFTIIPFIPVEHF